jgi:hypothetical protein
LPDAPGLGRRTIKRGMDSRREVQPTFAMFLNRSGLFASVFLLCCSAKAQLAPVETPPAEAAAPAALLRDVATRIGADASDRAIEARLEGITDPAVIAELRDRIVALRADVDRLLPLLDALAGPAFGNATNAPEGSVVLRAATATDSTLLAGTSRIELFKVFDAAEKPMNHHAGERAPTNGSYSELPLVGTSGAIMLWGPYEKLEPGRYLVVYRFQFLDEVAGEHVCFADVACKAVTYSGRRPGADTVPARVWNHVAVPIAVPKALDFEFRFWPQGHRIAMDRIYVYRLLEGDSPVFSVMGAVKLPGFYPMPAEGVTVEGLLEAAGDPHGLAAPERAILWRRGADGVNALPVVVGDNELAPSPVPGDLLWIPERKTPDLLTGE